MLNRAARVGFTEQETFEQTLEASERSYEDAPGSGSAS